MFTRRSRRLLTTWVALWALLGGALAPLVSHALQRDAVANGLEVCSVQGTPRLTDDGSRGPQTEGAGLAHALEHCPLCLLLHHPGWTPPPALAAAAVPALRAEPVPSAPQAAPRPQATWMRAPSRAPPFAA